MNNDHVLTRQEFRKWIYEVLRDLQNEKLTIAQAQKKILRAAVQSSKFLFLQRPWKPLCLHTCSVRVSYRPIIRRLNRDCRTQKGKRNDGLFDPS